ncbi:MAG: hypothetical protein PHU14_00245 [Methylovulum sp.]|nr:hypothetical protein [Methylovulum sp.]
MHIETLHALMRITIKSVLLEAGGQLMMLEMATRVMQKLGDDGDPREMIEASGFLPDDIIKLTDKGYRSIKAAGND